MISTANPHNPPCFVILVHYGPSAPTQRAVAALLSGTVAPAGVVIVDHAEQLLTGVAAPNVQIIRPSANTGYGAGINLGLGALLARPGVRRSLVVCMNGDVLVRPNTITRLLAWWAAHPDPALIGVMHREGGRLLPGLGHVSPWSGRAEWGRAATGRYPYVHGAFVAAPYHTFIAMHGWPDEYFLYWEDVVLGWRAARRGIPLRLAPEVVVEHPAPLAAPANPDKRYYLVRNGALSMMRELSWPQRWWWRLYNHLRLTYHRRRPGPAAAEVRLALAHALAGQTGKRPA